MRYLIAETTWETMSLAQDIATTGTFLTRTDRPEDVPHYLQTGEHDLVVLSADALSRDLRLPALRGSAPICVLAPAPRHDQVALWLDAGADTVIDLRSDSAEIVARLAAVARRAHGLSCPRLDLGHLQLNLLRRRAALGPVTLQLAPKLYEILEYLCLRPNRLVTRDALLSHVYALGEEPGRRVLDVYMCTLRASLAPLQGQIVIETARGSGFRLRAALPADRPAIAA